MSNDEIVSELFQEDPAFADIIEQFVNGLPDRLAAMESALKTQDFDALRVSAHQLKGSAGGYGYLIVTRRAADLERAAKLTAFSECKTHLAQLKEMCGRVVVGADQHV